MSLTRELFEHEPFYLQRHVQCLKPAPFRSAFKGLLATLMIVRLPDTAQCLRPFPILRT
ncbi:hypothetical protein BN2475_190119 [Paraburkholderia ribeironis]|uniref:Uncharacterized protein n=1 Tax=Paraburkholderia ribeironis TaxID=1247936 RepID=A0A1N7RVR4_9BURK|nr:hypothetical protein BN2475_190119 [Paraburkholderia ribeironis]